LSIYGQTKSLFEWNPEEIRAVCQQKHQELVGAGVRVVYRGRDITAAIYRVDCSRDMVGGPKRINTNKMTI
jgi:hypothetical protein